jgi:hypothetical protein
MPESATLRMIISIVETFSPGEITTTDDTLFVNQIMQEIKSQIWLSYKEEAQLVNYILNNLNLIRSHTQDHLIF